MEKNLENKVAIVTGGGSGIGKSTALLYAQHGAKVIVSDMNEKGGNETVEEIKANKGIASFIKADVSKPEDCKQLVESTLKLYNGLDIAFNNAGIGGESNPTAQLSIEGWNHVISINLSGVFYCMKYELEAMLKGGGGAIVNMSSILGQVGFENSAGYTAAKHGVVGLTQNAALEYSNKNIRINAVGPGFIDTPILNNLDAKVKSMLVQLHPIGRLGKPQEVAELVVWLSSPEASFVTGSYYPIDGGYLAR